MIVGVSGVPHQGLETGTCQEALLSALHGWGWKRVSKHKSKGIFIVQGAISRRFKSSFLSTKYTSLGANLPSNSFSETAPRYPRKFSRLDVIYPQVLECTLSQSNFPGMNEWMNDWCFRQRFCSVRLCWARDNLGECEEFCYESCQESNALPLCYGCPLSHLPWRECSTFSVAEDNHTLAIFVLPGTHYYWVTRGGVDSKHAQGFYTRPVLRESNPSLQDLRSNALTIQPRAPQKYSGL